jgi:hypothetical protein
VEETTSISLRKPLALGHETWPRLDLREPTLGELKRAGGGGSLTEAGTLIALITGIPPAAIDQLGQRDFQEACDFLAGFSKAAPTTGSSSPPS